MTVYLTNAASRQPPQRGPGTAWTIMAMPRAAYGETGAGPVGALVPPAAWVRGAQTGELSIEDYRARYVAMLAERDLKPGNLRGPSGPVGDGDTLLCACSRARAAEGRCHRVWAAHALRVAGWDVVLDGVAL